MTISHVCLGCGKDVGRVRARHDRTLGLWLVDCPTCSAVLVRRRTAMLMRRRRVRRLIAAWRAFIANVAIGAALLVASAAAVAALGASMRSHGFHWLSVLSVLDEEDPGGRLALVFLIVVALSVGVWIRVGLAHWRWPLAWLVWAGALALLLTGPTMLAIADDIHAQLIGAIPLMNIDHPNWPLRAAAYVAIVLVTPVGAVAGGVVRRTEHASRAGRWMKLLRRRRAARGRT